MTNRKVTPLRITGLTLHTPEGTSLLAATAGAPLIARVNLTGDSSTAARVTLSFYDFNAGTLLTACTGEVPPCHAAGRHRYVEFTFPELLLAAGVYTLGATVTPAGAPRPVAWRFGRTTLYVQGAHAGQGVFAQPFECRVSNAPGVPSVRDAAPSLAAGNRDVFDRKPGRCEASPRHRARWRRWSRSSSPATTRRGIWARPFRVRWISPFRTRKSSSSTMDPPTTPSGVAGRFPGSAASHRNDAASRPPGTAASHTAAASSWCSWTPMIGCSPAHSMPEPA